MARKFQMYPNPGWPTAEREILKSQTNNPLEYFLRHVALHDVVNFRDDFLGKAIDTTNLYTSTAGATATAFAIGALEDGNVRGSSGTTAATSGLQFSIANNFANSANQYGCEVRWQTSVVTNTRIEIGFVDALPAINTSLVNSLTTPTFNTVAKGALYVFDNASSTNTAGLYTIGSVAAAAKTAFTTPLPTASQFTTARIQVSGNKAALWVDGFLVAQPTADVVNGGDLVKFVFSHLKADTTTSNIDIDYIHIWKDRALTTGGV